MSLTLIVGLSLVVYRVTRFIMFDTLIEMQRKWFLAVVVVGKQPGPVRIKLHDLFTCFFCLSVWVAAATVAITDAVTSVPMPVWTWLAVAGAALIPWRFIEG